ncbi:TIGR03936 family radical SAM-associated protein [Bacillota bacterium LX-D]|nr:TIGR03936 family radical SAM-associated protein [Bacillota bacterium LX-D]
MRVRIRFAKGNQVRFISHLELMKTFERAIRRARIPIAFSEGFNPHPKMSFATALAVGVTADTEYLDLELRQEMSPEEVWQRLRQNLPEGFRILSSHLVNSKTPPLMSIVAAAEYEVKVKLITEQHKAQIDQAIEHLLEQDSVTIVKKGKKGLQNKEIRAGIFQLECLAVENGWATFKMFVQAGSKCNIRPEEVLRAIREKENIPLDLGLVIVNRTALLAGQEGHFVSPLELSGV